MNKIKVECGCKGLYEHSQMIVICDTKRYQIYECEFCKKRVRINERGSK